MAISYAEALQPFIVLDKNQLRRFNAADALAEAVRRNCRILLIDTLFVEIAGAANKGKDWKDQFEKDFRDWVQHPELLAVAKGFGELLRLERDTGTSALSMLVDEEMTKIVQDAVRELGVSGTRGLAKYDARMAAQVTRLTAAGAMLDPVANLAALRSLLDVWWQHGIWWSKDKEAAYRLMKTEVQNTSAAAYPAIGFAATADPVIGGIEDALLQTNAGYTPKTAKRLMSEPSFTFLVWTAREAMTLCYYAQGRKAAHLADADFELNQTLDTTYIGYGLACRQLRTAENIVRRLEAGLRQALADRWPSPDGSAKSLHQQRQEWAYFNWINRGRPEGDDWTDWLQAVAAVSAET